MLISGLCAAGFVGTAIREGDFALVAPWLVEIIDREEIIKRCT